MGTEIKIVDWRKQFFTVTTIQGGSNAIDMFRPKNSGVDMDEWNKNIYNTEKEEGGNWLTNLRKR